MMSKYQESTFHHHPEISPSILNILFDKKEPRIDMNEFKSGIIEHELNFMN